MHFVHIGPLNPCGQYHTRHTQGLFLEHLMKHSNTTDSSPPSPSSHQSGSTYMQIFTVYILYFTVFLRGLAIKHYHINSFSASTAAFYPVVPCTGSRRQPPARMATNTAALDSMAPLYNLQFHRQISCSGLLSQNEAQPNALNMPMAGILLNVMWDSADHIARHMVSTGRDVHSTLHRALIGLMVLLGFV